MDQPTRTVQFKIPIAVIAAAPLGTFGIEPAFEITLLPQLIFDADNDDKF
jgi:hypothetical protein